MFALLLFFSDPAALPSLAFPPTGIAPNTIMYNTAISALGKALRPEEAEALFAEMPAPDAVSCCAALCCAVLCCFAIRGGGGHVCGGVG